MGISSIEHQTTICKCFCLRSQRFLDEHWMAARCLLFVWSFLCASSRSISIRPNQLKAIIVRITRTSRCLGSIENDGHHTLFFFFFLILVFLGGWSGAGGKSGVKPQNSLRGVFLLYADA